MLDYVRYGREAVRTADLTGDLALRVGTRAYLAYGHTYCGKLEDVERVADGLIALVAGDAHLGAEIVGFSPLMAVMSIRLLAVGSLRDPTTALREFPRMRQAALDAGSPEQALWSALWERALRYALGNTDGLLFYKLDCYAFSASFGTQLRGH